MVWNRFDCRENPFRAGFDSRFVYLDPGQQGFFERLRHEVERGGLFLITGQAGTGKTTLLNKLAIELQDSVPRIFFFTMPVPTLRALAEGCCQQSGVENAKSLKDIDSIVACKEFLTGLKSAGPRVLLMDEAQSLTDEMIGSLLELVAPREDEVSLLSIILAGQPALADRFREEPFRARAHSIGFHFHLSPLDLRDIQSFIFHRLRAAGCTASNSFSVDAIERILLYSEGFQGRINSLCSLAFFFAAEQSETQVTAASIDLAASALLLKQDEVHRPPLPANLPPNQYSDEQRPAAAETVAKASAAGILPSSPRHREEDPAIEVARIASITAPIGTKRINPWTWVTASLAIVFVVSGVIWILLEPPLGQSRVAVTNDAAVQPHDMALDQDFVQPLDHPEAFPEITGDVVAEDVAPDLANTPRAIKTEEIKVDSKSSSSPEVKLLLASAEAHFNADRLVAPPFNNALWVYRKILRAEPGNRAALAGLEAIRTKLTRFAREEEALGDTAGARRQLQKIQLLDNSQEGSAGMTAGLAGANDVLGRH